MSKKVVLLAAVFLGLFTVEKLAARPLDLVILVDTSESMFTHFDEMNEYVFTRILKNHVEFGDTFHILSFNSAPHQELSRSIENENDIKQILKQIMLLNPLGKHTDLVRAVGYLHNYVGGLRYDSDKKIIILTDGIHDPPPESRYALTRENAMERISKIASDMRKEGYSIFIVRFPLQSEKKKENEEYNIPNENKETEKEKLQGPEEKNILTTLADELSAPVIDFEKEEKLKISHIAMENIKMTVPRHLGKITYSTRLPLHFENFSVEPQFIKLNSIIFQSKDILKKSIKMKINAKEQISVKALINFPENLNAGNYKETVSFSFDSDVRVIPTESQIEFEIIEKSGFTLPNLQWLGPIVLYLLLALAILVVIVVAVLFIRRIIEQSTAPNFLGKTDQEVEAYNRKLAQGIRPVEMRVYGQNSNIGLRNVHAIKKGEKRSIGGHNSDYLIFFSSFPHRIAEITMTDNGCELSLIKPEYFETLDKPLNGCLHKDIRLISDTGYRVTIRFRYYISELERINAVMRQIKYVGRPKIDIDSDDNKE